MNGKIGIVICSRTDSKRLPNKPFLKVNGKYLICHLLDRLVQTGMPVYIAVPFEQLHIYERKLESYVDWKGIYLYGGDKDDPLKRTHDVAKHYDLSHIVRVCHDKVFISYKQLDHFISVYQENKFDYIYSTNFIPGMGFEVFSMSALKAAAKTFTGVEHLSYAVESVAQNVCNLHSFPFNRAWLNRKKPNAGLRLLVDFPEDLAHIKKLIATHGSDLDIVKIVDKIENRPQPNALPEITVYTCSHEDTEYLERCAHSVLGQSFQNIEYLLIDDGSEKKPVFETMKRFKKDKRVRVVRNTTNMGLASSSNIANKLARGRYVIRLDADDYFIDERVLSRMLEFIERANADILYPDNYKDGRIQPGCEQHHIGGTLFRKRALDFIKFTDGLRHYDGLDLYHRAVMKGSRIEYFREPTFYYRQRAASMSNAPSSTRAEIKQKIESGLVGTRLVEVLSGR